MNKPRVIHSCSFVEDAANVILEMARSAIEARGIFRVSLCGGNTPRPVYEQLARSGEIPWENVQITFGDERCVPADHPQSNYRMARECLLDPAGIAPANVLRVQTERSPAQAALDYESRLQQAAARFGETRYVHDLLLLGLGEDGHTASLFPGTEALQETNRNVVANYVEKLSSHRITFTYPLINAARAVCFLVADSTKAGVVESVLARDPQYPASRVSPHSGNLTWLLGF